MNLHGSGIFNGPYPSLFLPPPRPPLSCQSLQVSFFFSSSSSSILYFILSVSVFSTLCLCGERSGWSRKGNTRKKLTGWMELLKRKSQMKRERKRETRNGKESGFEKEPGKMFSSLFPFFLIFPCELPSRSRAYSSTTQMAFRQKNFFLKREKKRNESDHTTRPRKNPVFSLHITTMNFVS